MLLKCQLVSLRPLSAPQRWRKEASGKSNSRFTICKRLTALPGQDENGGRAEQNVPLGLTLMKRGWVSTLTSFFLLSIMTESHQAREACEDSDCLGFPLYQWKQPNCFLWSILEIALIICLLKDLFKFPFMQKTMSKYSEVGLWWRQAPVELVRPNPVWQFE